MIHFKCPKTLNVYAERQKINFNNIFGYTFNVIEIEIIFRLLVFSI